MLDTDLFQTNYLGRDGFRWWIGQVADPDTSGWGNALESNTEHHSGEDSAKLGDKEIYTRRCKVRILGYHTISDENGYVLTDTDLPWAHIMVGPGLATQDGTGSFHQYKGGENVLGFFLDGEEAQQPVIIGGFGRGKQVKDETDPKSQTDCRIKPFTPNTQTIIKKGDTPLPQIHITKVKATKGEETGAKFKSPSSAQAGSQDENAGSKRLDTRNPRQLSRPTTCETPISDIETAIQNIMYVMQTIETYKDFYLQSGLDILTTLQNQIGSYVKQISGAIRKILEKIKSYLIKGLGDAFNSTIKALPETIKSVVAISFKQAIETILCVFEKIFGQGIFSKVLDYVNNFLIDGIIDPLLCTAEKLLSNLLSQFMNPILNEISGTIQLLKDIFGEIDDKVSGAITKAMEFFNVVLSFLECAPVKCHGPRTWTLAGPDKAPVTDVKNIIKGLNIPELDLGETEPFSCSDNISYFLPPIIQILGGGGAIGWPVIRDGRLIGVYVDEPGRGYSKPTPPIVTVKTSSPIDPAGGARVEAVVNDNGQIDSFIVKSSGSGYVSTPTFNKAIINDVLITSNDLNLPPDQLTDEKQQAINSLQLSTPPVSEDLNVIPILKDLQINTPGIGYDDGDSILIDGKPASDYGIIAELDISPNGSLVSINIQNENNQPIKFTDLPEVTIDTSTGANASINAVLDFIKVEDVEQVNKNEVITISNCPFK